MAPQSLSVFVSLFGFQIIVGYACYDVFSEGVVSINAVAFEAFVEVDAIHSMSNNGASALVIVGSTQTPKNQLQQL